MTDNKEKLEINNESIKDTLVYYKEKLFTKSNKCNTEYYDMIKLKYKDIPTTFIVSKEGCPYCTKTFIIMNSNGIKYKIYDKIKDKEFSDYVKNVTSHHTFPKIFLNKTFIGGHSELTNININDFIK
ncbi:GLRX1 [Hepatospora eriocheir]|uniref:GLRX1 n=1 Tax=Hepatospora eriocheir TaxID=1081669 RepID=A0A1X0QG49_9MICR|nr:GLRX1 [Hepatospora eriocheir]